MNKKVLVADATRASPAAEAAHAVAERLCAAGWCTKIQPVLEVRGLEAQHAVVPRSAVRHGAWLAEMPSFFESHRAALQALDDSAASREMRAGLTRPLHARATARDAALLSSHVGPATLSLFARLAMRRIKPQTENRRAEVRLRAWAAGLSAQSQ